MKKYILFGISFHSINTQGKISFVKLLKFHGNLLSIYLKIYLKDPAFFDSEPCDLSTNLPYRDVDEFMEEENKIKQGYFISW